jgi:hypothetical protein
MDPGASMTPWWWLDGIIGIAIGLTVGLVLVVGATWILELRKR